MFFTYINVNLKQIEPQMPDTTQMEGFSIVQRQFKESRYNKYIFKSDFVILHLLIKLSFQFMIKSC